MLPNQRKQDEKRETIYFEMIQNFIKNNREDNKIAFRSVSDTLTTLFDTIERSKVLSTTQIDAIMRKATSDTIQSIHSKLLTIINNNNLSENEDFITRDIFNYIENILIEGKDFLIITGIPISCMREFEDIAKQIKEDAYEKIKDYFTATIYNLRHTEKGIEEAYIQFNSSTELDKKIDMLRNIIEKKTDAEKEYRKLARNISNITECARNEITNKIKNIM